MGFEIPQNILLNSGFDTAIRSRRYEIEPHAITLNQVPYAFLYLNLILSNKIGSVFLSA